MAARWRAPVKPKERKTIDRRNSARRQRWRFAALSTLPCSFFHYLRCNLLRRVISTYEATELDPFRSLTQPAVSPVNASRLASRPEPRASLGAGAAGSALPRKGLAPPIFCKLSWRTLLRVLHYWNESRAHQREP
jgi:hypothetical protein